MNVVHSKSNVRAAKRLGIKLPDQVTPKVRAESSFGRDELSFGKPKSRVKRTVRRTENPVTVDGRHVRFQVLLRGRVVGDCATLRDAKALARWLGSAENRRTYRGLGPKGQMELVEALVSEGDAMEVLKAELSRINSGAVTVR